MALNLVKMAVTDPSHQRKPLAIVLDADETVVDNTKLMGESVANAMVASMLLGGVKLCIKVNRKRCQALLNF